MHLSCNLLNSLIPITESLPSILPSSICRKFKLETLGWKAGGGVGGYGDLSCITISQLLENRFLTANHQPSIHDGEELARSGVETQSHNNHWRNHILYSNIILHCCNSSSVARLLHIVLLPLELASAKQKNIGGTEKDMQQSRRRKWEKLQRRNACREKKENRKSCREGMHAE